MHSDGSRISSNSLKQNQIPSLYNCSAAATFYQKLVNPPGGSSGENHAVLQQYDKAQLLELLLHVHIWS